MWWKVCLEVRLPAEGGHREAGPGGTPPWLAIDEHVEAQGGGRLVEAAWEHGSASQAITCAPCPFMG